jgi:hypothetical protein
VDGPWQPHAAYRKNKRYFVPPLHGQHATSAATRRRIPRVSFFSLTKYFACILNK